MTNTPSNNSLGMVEEMTRRADAWRAQVDEHAETIRRLTARLADSESTLSVCHGRVRELEDGVRRALDQPNETASDGKALREMVRRLRSLVSNQAEGGK